MEVLIQVLNGVQLGLLMFLLAAGLTLTFGIMDLVNLAHGSLYMVGAYIGIMDLVNLAHGSLYMVGAYIAWTFITWTDSFVLGALLALPATFVVGVVVEVVIARRLYVRDHLDQVLATFGLILFFNDAVRLIWGPAGLALPLPAWLTVPIEIMPGVFYPSYRLAIIAVCRAELIATGTRADSGSSLAKGVAV